jgi:ATPase family AAA domain-containing protein 3A/B
MPMLNHKESMKRLVLLFLLVASLLQADTGIQIGGHTITAEQLARELRDGADAAANIHSHEIYRAQETLKEMQEKLIKLAELTAIAKQKHDFVKAAKYDAEQAIMQDNIAAQRAKIKHAEEVGDRVSQQVTGMINGAWNTVLADHQARVQGKMQIAAAAASAAESAREAGKANIEIAKLGNAAWMERFQTLSEPDKLKTIALFLGGATLAMTGGYYGVKVAAKWAEQKLENIPALTEETSRSNVIMRIVNGIKEYFIAPTVVTISDEIVFEPVLQKKLENFATSLKVIHERNLKFSRLLMYGPPGTGKTHFAKLIARWCGMDYVITSADRMSQFAEGKDVEEFHALLDWAEASPNGMLIFIDEIDALGCHRDKLDQRWIKLQNAFLARTGSLSNKFTIIGATNRIHALDTAFLDRFSQIIEIPLPAQPERIRLINLYMKKYIVDNVCTVNTKQGTKEIRIAVDPSVTEDLIAQLAQSTEGFSGRKIDQALSAVQNACHMQEEPLLTADLFTSAINEFIAQQDTKNKIVAAAQSK